MPCKLCKERGKTMKEHIKAQMINNLRDIAIEFHDHQSLRQRILGAVNDAEEADRWWHKENEFFDCGNKNHTHDPRIL